VGVNSTTFSWTLALFFGCSIAFMAIRKATEDQGTGVTLVAQLGFLIVVVTAIVLIARRRDEGGGDS
jgi:hypothetical protein